MAYISAAECIGVSSTTFTQSVPKATEFGEITLPLGLLRRWRSSKVTEFGTNRKLICDFLLVINSNLASILHHFRDIAFDRSKIAIFGYTSCVQLPRRRGSPGTISAKFLPKGQNGQGTKRRRNVAENFSRLSRVHERYRRQKTDGRTTTYSECERTNFLS